MLGKLAGKVKFCHNPFMKVEPNMVGTRLDDDDDGVGTWLGQGLMMMMVWVLG